MKALVGFSALVTSLVSLTSVAQANCTAKMYTWNNQLIARFNGYDCYDAKQRCEQDLRFRHQRGMNPNARCIVDNYRPNPRPQPNYGMWTCTAKDRGWEEHFAGHSANARGRFEAERLAMRYCLQAHGSCYISSCTQR